MGFYLCYWGFIQFHIEKIWVVNENNSITFITFIRFELIVFISFELIFFIRFELIPFIRFELIVFISFELIFFIRFELIPFIRFELIVFISLFKISSWEKWYSIHSITIICVHS